MYRAGSICIDKEVITEANKIIFDFIWKGKDKVKRTSLIGDTKDGGLKAPHLESIIMTQRIMVCKRFADEEPCAWKTILSHYLKPVGDKIILYCDFDVKQLPINLSNSYQECLKCFTQCSAAAYEGLIRIGDLVTEGDQFISQCYLRQRDFSPKDVFDLMALIDAIPAPWRQSLKMNGYVNKLKDHLFFMIKFKLF